MISACTWLWPGPAGARGAAYIPLRLPYALKELFDTWLATHFPDRREKVLHRIREIRGGKLNDAEFGSRMRGEGEFAELIGQRFRLACRRYGITRGRDIVLDTKQFAAPRRASPQGELF